MFEKRQFRQFSRNCQYLHLRLLIFLIIVEDDRSSGLQDKLCFYKTEETNFCLDLSSLTATWHLVHWYLAPLHCLAAFRQQRDITTRAFLGAVNFSDLF